MNLELRSLEFGFQGERPLFSDFNFQLRSGELTVLLGPSGSGKSTLLRLLAGLLRASRGEIRRDEGLVGFVFQEPRLLAWLTVRENLNLPGRLQNMSLAESQVQQLLRRVNLDARVADLFPHQLSGGMKMRVALARALVGNPQLLLMDEPLAALDETTREFLQEEVARISTENGITTVFVTHSLSEALWLGDRILVLSRDGKLREDLRPGFARPRTAALRSNPDFQKAWDHLRSVLRAETAVERNT